MSRLFQDTLLYGLSAALSRSTALLVMPVLGRRLGAVEYGVVALAGIFGILLGVLADLQVSAGMGRHYHEQPDDDRRRLLVASGFNFIALLSAPLVIVTLWQSEFLSRLLFGSSDFELAVTLVTLQIPVQTLLGYLLYVLRLAGMRSAYLASSMATAVTGALLSVGLVVYGELGWKGAVLGLAAGQVAGFVIALAAARRQLAFSLSVSALRSMLRYGLPGLPAVAGGAVQIAFGSIFLSHYLSLQEVGIYAVGMRISQIIGVFHTSFGLGWYPFLLQSLSNHRGASAGKSGVMVYSLIGLPLLCASAALAPELVALLAGPEYTMAVLLVPVLCFGELLVGFVPIVNLGIISSKRTYLASLAYLISAAVTVAATILLARSYGALGAAFALAGGRWIQVIATELLSRLVRQGLPDWPVVLQGILWGLGLVILSTSSWQMPWMLRLGFTVAGSATACLVLFSRRRPRASDPPRNLEG